MPANSVIAKAHNKNSYEEGFATEAIDVATGCVIDTSGTETTVSPAPANSPTARVVREPRNPPQPINEGVMESPLTQSIDVDGHVETVGFNRFDEARLRLAGTATSGAADVPFEAGWDSNGELSDVDTDGATALTTYVGRVQEVLTDVSADFDVAVMEFY